MGAINAYFCSWTRALIICCKSRQICSTAAGGGKKSRLRACRSLFELLIFIDSKCGDATEGGSHAECPVAPLRICFPSFSTLGSDQRWLVEVGRGKRKASQVAAHIHLRKPHQLSPPSVGHVSTSLSNVDRLQKKKTQKTKT